jgi:hypothetical protein
METYIISQAVLKVHKTLKNFQVNVIGMSIEMSIEKGIILKESFILFLKMYVFGTFY